MNLIMAFERWFTSSEKGLKGGSNPDNKYYDTNLPDQNEYRTNKLDLAYTASSQKSKSGHIVGRLEHSALRQYCSRCVISLAIKMV